MGQRYDLEGLGRSVADALDRRLGPDGSDEAVRWRIADEAARRPRPSAGRRRAGVAAASLLVVAVGLVTAWLHLRSSGTPDRLSFTVGDPPMLGRTKDLQAASERSPLVLHFSEGTTLSLQPMARGRILDVTDRGAEILLESGRARFEVEHLPQARWQVRSGSFLIQVVGTKFDAGYDPRTEELVVSVDEGRVMVSGCELGAGHTVRAGEWVRASCPPRDTAARASPQAPGPVQADPAGEPAEEPLPPAPEMVGRDRASSQGESVRRPGEPRSGPGARRLFESRGAWVELARQGRYVEAWDQVKEGFARECQLRPASELWLLGDTARLTGHGREARRAYEALRERFHGTAAAANSAFALGRLAVEIDGDATAAERWFETHLGERPEGPLAASALGRIMDLRLERGDRKGAASVAREYLRRFPEGPRGPGARALLAAADRDAARVDAAR